MNLSRSFKISLSKQNVSTKFQEGIVGAVSLLLLENVAESLDEEVQRCNENSTLCSVETAVQVKFEIYLTDETNKGQLFNVSSCA